VFKIFVHINDVKDESLSNTEFLAYVNNGLASAEIQ
jgi:hypothetical protein